jgi:DnaJ-class molecular chaperone
MICMLALQYHPDTAKDTTHSKEQFIKVSEAWSVLSKPELKSQYDSLRRQYLYRKSGNVDISSSGSLGEHAGIFQGFHVQRHNLSHVQHKACSNWQDIQDKYKTEKWQRMTLDQRKATRLRPVVTAKGGALIIAPLVFAAGILYSLAS